MRTTISGIALVAALSLGLAACSSGGDDESATSSSPSATSATAQATTSGDLVSLKVGASPVPHAQILQFVKDNLAQAAGLDIEIVEFQDYILPNQALAEGDIDANYFQHLPYYEQQVADRGYDFAHFAGVHIEPMGIYSQNLTDLTAVADGAKVGLTDDPSNQARGLALLAQAGLITLPAGVDDPSALDIKGSDNPKNLQFVEMAAEQLPRALPDLDLAVINGNYALAGGLKPSQDALLLESGQNNPYANIVAVRAGDESRPELVKLDELMHSQAVADFIKQTWPDGEVIPAF